MNRRDVLKTFAKASLLAPGSLGVEAAMAQTTVSATKPLTRVRPGMPDGRQRHGGKSYPTPWADASSSLTIRWPPAGEAPDGAACQEFFKAIHNPYFISDDPALTETSGWVDAWTSTPSVYVIKAESTEDVVAAVNFARDNNLRLVVKGGGHSYQGTSASADLLLIWTRNMNGITLHDGFVARGCDGTQAPQPAVTVETGARWLAVYEAVTTRGGRYVQGGGCTTVGVAGFINGGGFGSFSKRYGLGAAALLEAEIVTADGGVLVVNACNHPELFWGIKGGGGGSLGVLIKLTLRTRDLPATFGAAIVSIKATSDAAFRDLDCEDDELLRGEPVQCALGRADRFRR